MTTLTRLALSIIGALLLAAAFGAGFMMMLCARFGDDWPQAEEEYLF